MHTLIRIASVLGFFCFASSSLLAQTVYIPGGAGGIAASPNGNVGIGTAVPDAKLALRGENIELSLGRSAADTNGYGRIGFTSVFEQYIANNAYWNGTAWNYVNPAGYVGVATRQINSYGAFQFDTASGGTNPVAWNTRLYINNAGNVGIGTTVPGAKLEVRGDELRIRSIVSKTDATARGLLRLTSDDTVGPNNLEMLFSLKGAAAGGSRLGQIQVGDNGYFWATLALNPYGGNVGIGTTNVAAPLHVVGNTAQEVARFQGATDASNFRNFISIYTTNPSYWWELSNQGPAGNGSLNGLSFRERSAAGSSIERVYFASGGNVGIGTMFPTERLSVNGTIRAKEVIVDLTGWSDYVFEEDYRLAPLAEVEQHIKDRKHLPGIPSAAEVAAHGVSMGDMQSRLLAKIEELTLHMIAQEKRLVRLEAENARLRGR